MFELEEGPLGYHPDKLLYENNVYENRGHYWFRLTKNKTGDRRGDLLISGPSWAVLKESGYGLNISERGRVWKGAKQ